MALRELYDFSEHIKSVCPQLDDEMMEIEVQNAMKRFCEETDVYRRELQVMPLTAHVSVYDINPVLKFPDLELPSGEPVVEATRIISMRNPSGEAMMERFFDDMERAMSFEKWYQETADSSGLPEFGEPRHFIPIERSKFIVYPTPDEDMELSQVQVAMRPVYSSSYIPADMFDNYYLTISACALMSLCRQRRKPWYNPEVAMQKEREYRKDVSKYKDKGRKRFYRGTVRMNLAPGAVSRRVR